MCVCVCANVRVATFIRLVSGREGTLMIHSNAELVLLRNQRVRDERERREGEMEIGTPSRVTRACVCVRACACVRVCVNTRQ